jgi:hypothetical protein
MVQELRPEVELALYRALFPQAMWWLEMVKSSTQLALIPMHGAGLIWQAAELEYSDHINLARLLEKADQVVGLPHEVDIVSTWQDAIRTLIMRTTILEQQYIVKFLMRLSDEHIIHREIIAGLFRDGWVRNMIIVSSILPSPFMRRVSAMPKVHWILSFPSVNKLLTLLTSNPVARFFIHRHMVKMKGS